MQDYEWRLEMAGFASEHVKAVTVIHGAEAAQQYESGSMVALQKETGDAGMREAFVTEMLRGANRLYMLQKWGAIKPSRPGARHVWESPPRSPPKLLTLMHCAAHPQVNLSGASDGRSTWQGCPLAGGSSMRHGEGASRAALAQRSRSSSPERSLALSMLVKGRGCTYP